MHWHENCKNGWTMSLRLLAVWMGLRAVSRIWCGLNCACHAGYSATLQGNWNYSSTYFNISTYSHLPPCFPHLGKHPRNLQVVLQLIFATMQHLLQSINSEKLPLSLLISSNSCGKLNCKVNRDILPETELTYSIRIKKYYPLTQVNSGIPFKMGPGALEPL